MLRSKKGMEIFTLLLVMVVATVILIIFITLFVMVADNAKENAESTRCKTSVVAYARLNSLPEVPFVDTGTADEAAIDCPTKYITLYGDAQEMRQDIANLMFQCWDNFGRGKIKLFKAEDQKFCVVCSVFQFDDKTTKLTGLTSYLMIEKAPALGEGGKSVSYSEFLTGVKTNAEVIDRAKQTVDTNYLDGSKRYAIMFTFFKESYWSQLERAVVGAAVGFAAGVVVVVGVVVGAVVTGASWGIGAPVGAMIITGAAAAGAAIAVSGADSSAGVATSGAAWDANLVLADYSPDGLKTFGCQSLPVSLVDAKFK